MTVVRAPLSCVRTYDCHLSCAILAGMLRFLDEVVLPRRTVGGHALVGM
eukprot:SAG25_NODE_5185_length_692_cov_0.667791_2_plen_48_part_01